MTTGVEPTPTCCHAPPGSPSTAVSSSTGPSGKQCRPLQEQGSVAASITETAETTQTDGQTRTAVQRGVFRDVGVQHEVVVVQVT